MIQELRNFDRPRLEWSPEELARLCELGLIAGPAAAAERALSVESSFRNEPDSS